MKFAKIAALSVLIFCFTLSIKFFIWRKNYWVLNISENSQGQTISIYQKEFPTKNYQINVISTYAIKDNYTIVAKDENSKYPSYIKSLFFDQTVLPGKWNLNIHGYSIELFSEKIVVNGIEYRQKDSPRIVLHAIE